jgi:hypothetical protein
MSLLVCGFFWSANSTSQARDFHYPNLREFRMEFRYRRSGLRSASQNALKIASQRCERGFSVRKSTDSVT